MKQQRRILGSDDVDHFPPIPVQVIFPHPHILIPVHNVHLEVFVFGQNKRKPYHFVTFIFFLLEYYELRLVLVGELKGVPELFALKKSCKPLGEVAHFAHWLFLQVLIVMVARNDAPVKEGDVGFAGQLNFVGILGVFLEQSDHNLVFNFKFLVLDNSLDLLLECFRVIVLKAGVWWRLHFVSFKSNLNSFHIKFKHWFSYFYQRVLKYLLKLSFSLL